MALEPVPRQMAQYETDFSEEDFAEFRSLVIREDLLSKEELDEFISGLAQKMLVIYTLASLSQEVSRLKGKDIIIVKSQIPEDLLTAYKETIRPRWEHNTRLVFSSIIYQLSPDRIRSIASTVWEILDEDEQPLESLGEFADRADLQLIMQDLLDQIGLIVWYEQTQSWLEQFLEKMVLNEVVFQLASSID